MLITKENKRIQSEYNNMTWNVFVSKKFPLCDDGRIFPWQNKLREQYARNFEIYFNKDVVWVLSEKYQFKIINRLHY